MAGRKPENVQGTDLPEDSRPPIFSTWGQLYAFVLILHALLIFLFWLFTQYYK